MLLIFAHLKGEPLPRPAPKGTMSNKNLRLIRNGLGEGGYSRRELPQLVAHHVLRDSDVVIDLPIVDLELQPHEVRQDGRRARLRLYRRRPLSRRAADDG